MIEITPQIALDEAEVSFEFARAGGPGGQHVNKVETAVRLRFDAMNSPSLPEEVRERLLALAKGRLTREGAILIEARRHRSQEKNRRDALERLVELIRRAAEPPVPRHATKPTRASKERRLTEKKRRSGVKQKRGGHRDDE